MQDLPWNTSVRSSIHPTGTSAIVHASAVVSITNPVIIPVIVVVVVSITSRFYRNIQ
jgi:hypothetical protein